MKRRLPQSRIAAYECTIDGTEISQGKRAASWYGTMSEARLHAEIVPHLDELAKSGLFSYPFVIVTYSLEPEVGINPTDPTKQTRTGRQVRVWGQKFTVTQELPRRQRRGPEKRVAVVEGPGRFALLA